MTSTEKLNCIDTRLSVTGNCNQGTINKCCRTAIEMGARNLVSDVVVISADLTVDCDGPDPDLGCQAKITGELLDTMGGVHPVDETARDLLARITDVKE